MTETIITPNRMKHEDFESQGRIVALKQAFLRAIAEVNEKTPVSTLEITVAVSEELLCLLKRATGTNLNEPS